MSWMDDIRKAAKEKEQLSNTTRESLLSGEKEEKQQSENGEVYDNGVLVRKSDGTLTDYGKMLQTQTEAQQIASTYKPPTTYNSEKGIYGGLDPTYEAYVSQNVPSGNKVLSREQWAQSIAGSKEKGADAIRASLSSSYNQPLNSGTTTATAGTYLGGGASGLTGGSTNSLLEQQRQASLNTTKTGLGATRENVLANLSTKKSEIDPRIAQSRASAVSGTTIAQKRLADLIPFSGTMAGAQVSKGEELNTDLQNRQSALDVEREQSFKDIATQETETERAYQQGLALAESQAQEKYLTEQLNNARTAEERAYAQQQLDDVRAYNAQIATEERAYKEQQALEERAYKEQQNKVQQDREDYLTNIGQFSQNYQKEINNLLAQGVPETDYRIMALRNQRTQKLGAMAEAEQNAYVEAMKDMADKQEQAFELAKWRFENGLPATRMDSELLGVAVGSKIPSQVIKDNELALKQQKAYKTSSGGSSSGSSGSSTSGSQITTPAAKTSTIKSQIDNNIKTEIETRGLSNTASTLAQLRADQVVKYAENNQLTDAQAAELIATYGLTQAQIEQAERRLELIRGLGGQ